MADVRLFQGNFPYFTGTALCPGSGEFGPPFADKIAAEYCRGSLTPAYGLYPKWSPRQQELLTAANVGVGDFIQLVTIPQKHAVRGIVVDVDPEFTLDARCGGPSACDVDTMTGVTFDVVARFVTYDRVTKTETIVSTLTLDAAFTGIDGATRDTIADVTMAEFVPAGQTLVIGIVLQTPPNNGEIVDMAGIINVAVDAKDFDYPVNL